MKQASLLFLLISMTISVYGAEERKPFRVSPSTLKNMCLGMVLYYYEHAPHALIGLSQEKDILFIKKEIVDRLPKTLIRDLYEYFKVYTKPIFMKKNEKLDTFDIKALSAQETYIMASKSGMLFLVSDLSEGQMRPLGVKRADFVTIDDTRTFIGTDPFCGFKEICHIPDLTGYSIEMSYINRFIFGPKDCVICIQREPTLPIKIIQYNFITQKSDLIFEALDKDIFWSECIGWFKESATVLIKAFVSIIKDNVHTVMTHYTIIDPHKKQIVKRIGIPTKCNYSTYAHISIDKKDLFACYNEMGGKKHIDVWDFYKEPPEHVGMYPCFSERHIKNIAFDPTGTFFAALSDNLYGQLYIWQIRCMQKPFFSHTFDYQVKNIFWRDTHSLLVQDSLEQVYNVCLHSLDLVQECTND